MSHADAGSGAPVPTGRVKEGARLAYFRERADADYWEQHWLERTNRASYEAYEQGRIPVFGPIFDTYLPTDTPILEAGCGPAHIVVGLAARGYRVEGVDWAAQTVARVQAMFPELLLRAADVCDLPAEDATYGAYISLGVIEHRREGPEPFLREAVRVLKPGGIAMVDVPWFNPVRRMKAAVGCLAPPRVGMEFYQYAFRRYEMRRFLEDVGLRVIDSLGHNARMGLEAEWPWLQRLYHFGPVGRRLKRWIRLDARPGRACGHMHLFVAQKEK